MDPGTVIVVFAIVLYAANSFLVKLKPGLRAPCNRTPKFQY